MFYSKFMFIKKGPFAKVWLAAHNNKKLSKSSIVSTNISEEAEEILKPPAPLALRLSGHLLLGLVKIYQRKVAYLQDDCNEALTKIKVVFRPSNVDLPADAAVAPVNAITFADHFDVMELDVPDLPLDELLAHGEAIVQQARGEAAAAAAAGSKAGRDSLALVDLPMEDDYAKPDLHMDEPVPMGMEAELAGGEDLLLQYEQEQQEATQQSMREVEQARATVEEEPQPYDMDVPPAPLDDDQLPLPQAGGDESLLPDASQLNTTVGETPKKAAKKRRLERMDEVTELSRKQVEEQKGDTTDLVTERDFVPLKKKPRLLGPFAGASLLDLETDQWGSKVSDFLQKAMSGALPKVGGAAAAAAAEAEEEKAIAPEEEPLPDEPFPEMEIPMDNMAPGGMEELEHIFADQNETQDGKLAAEEGEEKEAAAAGGDQEAPPSMFTPQAEEEKAAKESGGWSRRTQKMHDLLGAQLADQDQVRLFSLIQGRSRATAASIFYELLVLQTHDAINMKQQRPYGDIMLSKADSFDNPDVAAADE